MTCELKVRKFISVPDALAKRPWNAGDIIRNAFRFMDCLGECRAKCCRNTKKLAVSTRDPNFHKIMTAMRKGKFNATMDVEQIGAYIFVQASAGICGFLDLETNMCSIYPIRPSICRAYPFLAFITGFRTGVQNSSEPILRLTTECLPVSALVKQGIDVITLADIAGTRFLCDTFSEHVSSVRRGEYPQEITIIGKEENRVIPIF